MSFFRKTTLLVALGSAALGAQAQLQSLMVPVEQQQAYDKGTRSPNGQPGPNYWQNHSDYRIRATLDPATRRLAGTETITYTNESPTTLTQLVLRLYPDIFKKDAVRDEQIDPEDLNDTGVVIEKLLVNGEEWPASRLKRQGTNLVVNIATRKLESKKSLTLDVTWNYTIPKKTHIREGTYFNTSFMVAYWYPQMAVYDDIDGWDTFNYTGPQEFYNDFSNFDVEVTVPASHLVWATGVWQNPDEILTTEILSRYQQARTADDVVRIVTEADRARGGIAKATSGTHTFRYRAEHVPDFAFAASDTYLWDGSSVEVEPGRRTAVAAVYHPSSKDFREVARYARQSVGYFSKTLPGVPFPYPNETVFNGSGGMEFPMFVNDGSYPDDEAAEVTAHEIAHSYFPFYMGINERKYAWMDEGWAQYLPNGIEFPINGQTFQPQQTNAQYYSYFAGREMDMPMMVPSVQLTGNAYTFASYFRPSQAYAFLDDLLGRDKFRAALQEYMRRWNGKHPTPYDFFFSFNDFLKEDLSWYWKPWFFEKGYPDLGVSVTTPKKGKTAIRVTRKGNLPVPIRLRLTFADGTTEEIRETARVWQDGKTSFTVEKAFPKALTKVELGGLQVPDSNRKDNVWEGK
jgi:hypothetical protein